MLSDQLKAVLERVATWPEEWQQRLLRLAVELEAEMSNSPYQASSDELRSIDEGLAGEAVNQEEIKKAYVKFAPP